MFRFMKAGTSMPFRPATLRNLACTILIATGSPALAQDYGEWRALTEEEDKARIGDTVAESIDPSTIEADFDGDGRTDTALIAVRKADGTRDLIVDLGRSVHVLIRSEERGMSVDPEAGLGLAKPRRWDTICGKALRKLQGGLCESERYPASVTLKLPGILYIENGLTQLYYWDRKKKAFESVVLVN